MRLQRLSIGRYHRFLPRLDQTIQARLAKDRADAHDQADGQIAVRVRKSAMAFCGQPPLSFWTTDLAGLVIEGHQPLGVKFCEMLSYADIGDAEGVSEGAR
jgi:hypothetical protein